MFKSTLEILRRFGLRSSIPSEGLLVEKSDSSVTVLEVRKDQSVLETLLKARIEVSHSCGGMGTCGTCRVKVLRSPPDFPERNEIECEFARARNFEFEERLACQLEARVGLSIRVPCEKSNRE